MQDDDSRRGGGARGAGAGARIRRVVLRAILSVGVFVGCLVAIEGVSSLVLLVREIREDPIEIVAERRHTTYDPLLGWVNVPNRRIAGMYGPGRPLTINGQGFRSERDFDVKVPAGRLRVVCSGDSFTLGFGVGDHDTWVHRLSVLDPRLETVNMGQGGYGVDQAYLWYKRDGIGLDLDVHVVAFITGDFHRMKRNVFHVYPKPVLELADGELRVGNTPVPESAYRFPWLTQNRAHLEELRTIELLRPPSDPAPARAGRKGVVLDELALYEVSQALFEDLARIAREKNSVLVAVHLPTHSDHQPGKTKDAWRHFLEVELGKRQIPYIDLVVPYRDLPAEETAALFIAEGELAVFGAAGHFSIEGNHLFAELLSTRLAEIPDVAARLARLDAD
jgi:hypothetical protein